MNDDLKNAITYINGKKPNQIYFVTDLHFYKRECRNKKPFNTKTKMKQFLKNCNKLKPNDVLVVLGDIGHRDCNFELNEKIKNFLKSIPIKKILVKGNHDILSLDYYRECGFIYIVDYLPYRNCIFSHIPVVWDNKLSPKYPINNQYILLSGYKSPKQWVSPKIYKYNIHGHIHGSNEYWDTTRKGHFDIWRNNHKFVCLDSLI